MGCLALVEASELPRLIKQSLQPRSSADVADSSSDTEASLQELVTTIAGYEAVGTCNDDQALKAPESSLDYATSPLSSRKILKGFTPCRSVCLRLRIGKQVSRGDTCFAGLVLLWQSDSKTTTDRRQPSSIKRFCNDMLHCTRVLMRPFIWVLFPSCSVSCRKPRSLLSAGSGSDSGSDPGCRFRCRLSFESTSGSSIMNIVLLASSTLVARDRTACRTVRV